MIVFKKEGKKEKKTIAVFFLYFNNLVYIL